MKVQSQNPLPIQTTGSGGLFNATGDMSQAAGLTSQVLGLEQAVGFSISAVYTGTPSGSLVLQVTNDGTNFFPLAGSTVTVTTAGSNIWTVSAAYYKAVQVVYTFTASTGVLTLVAFAKGASSS